MKHLAAILAALVCAAAGSVGAVALAGNGNGPPAGGPPGQGECEHGNSGQECRPDPQPEHGKDCEEHGQQGGVNEDHCLDETEPPTTTGEDPPTTTGEDPPTTTGEDPPVTTVEPPTETTPPGAPPRGCPDGLPANAGKDGNVPASGNTNDECDRSTAPKPPVTETGGSTLAVTSQAPIAAPAAAQTPSKASSTKPKTEYPTPTPDDPPVVVKVEKKAHGVVRITTSDGKTHTGVMGSG